MKISKKILGVALALIMIFNVFAVGTFAAYPDDTLVSLGMTTDKAVYAPGDTITITFNAECLPELGMLSIGGQYEVAYNSAVLEPSSTDTENLEAHGFVAVQSGADLGSASIQIPAGSSGASALYDWDTAITYCFGDDGSGFDATSRVNLYSINLVVKEDAPDGTYTIGFNPAGYEEYNAYINDGIGMGGLYGPSATDLGFSVPNTYEYGTATFKVSSGPAVEVTHAGTQAKYRPNVVKAENYIFGFVGNVSGLAVDTVAQDGRDVVTNIQSIKAIGTYNGTTVESEVITMWADGDDYGFRAVFSGFDYLDTNAITVNFVITMADGTTTYATAETATDSANGIYNAAVGRGMPAIA